MTEDNEFRRGQDGAFDLMWEAFGRAENLLTDDEGKLDPHARAVLAVVRSELLAAVEAVSAAWVCDERVERARASSQTTTTRHDSRGEG